MAMFDNIIKQMAESPSLTPAAAAPAQIPAAASGTTMFEKAELVNAPEGATAINPATGQPMALSYKNRADVPEGAQVIGVTRPARTIPEAIARSEAARRGEPDPLATYKVVSLPHAEGELYKKTDGLYGFMKDGKEYYYTPKEFGAYGVLSTSSDPKYGRDLLVNRNLQNKDVLSAGKATKLDPDTMKMVSSDDYFGNLKNPYDGYVWAANDYIKAVNPSYNKSYNDGSYETTLNKNISAFKPDFYGEFLGYNKNGDYVYKKGDQTTVWDPTGTRQTMTYIPPEKSNLQKFAEDLGPIPTIATAIFAPEFLPLVSGAQTAIRGGDITDVIKSAGKSYALGQLGQYGQEVGGAVNQYVDAALSDLGAAGDVLGNVAGTTTAGLIASRGKADPLELLKAGALGEAVSNLAPEIPGYDKLSDAGKRSVNNAIAAELQGRNPTPALLNLAKAAGQSAMANATNVPTEEQVAQQQADFQKQFAQYEEAAPTPSTPNYSVQEMQITPENLASYQQTLSDNFQGSQWTPGGGGDYTLTGDDGSTITMHKDGTTSATEAPPENLLDAIGTTGGQPTQAASGTQPTQAPTAAQPTQTTAAPTPEAAPKGLSVDQLASLYSLFEGETPAAAPQAAEQGAASAQAYAPAKEASFLGELGEKPHYLEGLDPETMALLNQLGIDPAELMAQQEAEGGAESADEHGEEGADYLEAPGGAGGFRTREGVKRGLPAGTLGIAGSDVAKAYQAARADQGFDTSRAFKLPIDDYSRAYMQQLAKAGEAALGEQWAPYIGGRKLAASGQPSADMTQSGNTLAYVPSASIGQYKGFTGALAPELVAMVGKDPGLLNDPDYLAAVLGHELSHQPQQNAGQFMRDLGIHPGKVGAESMAMSKDIASAIPYLAEKYGYKGFYDTKENAPLNERLADIGGWQMQNQVNLTQDPIFKEQVLKTPERMAVYNAMMPQRGVQLDPSFPPVGQLTLEDFGGMNPPVSWAYKNLTPEQFREQLKRRLSGMFGQ